MTSTSVRTIASTSLLSVLAAVALAACGGGKHEAAQPGPTTGSGSDTGATAGGAECSAEECAKAIEPPIAPDSCGPGNPIATACKRVPSGECQKVLDCKGADAPAASPH